MSNSSSSSPQQEDSDLITLCFTVLSFTGNWDTEKNREESTQALSGTSQGEKVHLHFWAWMYRLSFIAAAAVGETRDYNQILPGVIFCLFTLLCFCFRFLKDIRSWSVSISYFVPVAFMNLEVLSLLQIEKLRLKKNMFGISDNHIRFQYDQPLP